AVGTALVGIFVFREPATFLRIFFLTTLILSLVGLRAVSH
ncbi:MAG: QacE family quaternary ammonium compound efflux SMR transporter, partial [Bacteroidales bacterium]|nr:QacE family quaternary ammonium compound efflux SMR transporter [Bacteroidales bacterium]MCA1760973.1 QacE family quaternary ammonium compound efflux SMR transporter [Bacteroidales bacterium]